MEGVDVIWFNLQMSRRFLPLEADEISLLASPVLDYLSLLRRAHFVRDLLRDGLDLEAMYALHYEARGVPAFHPMTTTGLLL